MSIMDETSSDLPVKDTDCKPAVIRAIQEKDLKTRRRVSLVSREELEDNFLHLHEEHLFLKDYARKQEDKIKRMGTKLLRLTSELGRAGDSKTVSARKDGRDLEAEETIEDLQDRVRDLERRNEALQNRMTTYKQRLQVQDGCRHCPYSAVLARIDSGVRKNTALPDKTRRGLRVQGLEKRPPHVSGKGYGDVLSDEARLEIDRLFHTVENQNSKVDESTTMLLKNMVAMRSKDAGTEMMLSLQRAQQAEDQRTVLQENVMQIRLQKELREKNTSLCALREQFQQLKESYETELEEKQKTLTLSHKAVLTQLEDLSTQLKEERAKVVDMEVEHQSVLNLQKSLEEFQDRVTDLEMEKELIKEHYENLLKSTMEVDHSTPWHETEKQLREQISQLESQTHSLMFDHTQSKEQLLHEREKTEQLKQEISRLQVEHLEKINEIHALQEKLSTILSTRNNADTRKKDEVTSFRQKCPEYRRLREVNEQIERPAEKEENVYQIRREEETVQHEATEQRREQEEQTRKQKEKELVRKIHEMDATHAETILELEKTREMLFLQHKINKDYQEELQTVRLRTESESREREQMEQTYKDRLLQRDSKIQKLDAQLKDIAYGTYAPQTIKAESPSSDVDIAQLPVLHRGQTLFEVHIGSICFSPKGLRDVGDPQPITFCIYSFYDFETHATPIVSGARPQYSFTSSYAVIPDPDFLRFLRVGTLTVELYQVLGGEHHELARGRLKLEATLQNRDTVHSTTVMTDASGEVIAELDYWLRLHGPLSQTQRLQRQRNKAIGYLSTHRQGASFQIDGPQNVLVIRIWGCRRLWGGRIGYQPSPYAVYHFYHHLDHSTAIIPCSNNPQFGDEAFYPLTLTIDLERYLQKQRLSIYVFDDEETQPGGYLGRAEVPLLTLAQGNSIQGDFVLLNPDGRCSGSAQVSLEWKFPYQAPGQCLWDSVTSGQHLPEKSLERPLSQKHLQDRVLFRKTPKVLESRSRQSKSRRVEENQQCDIHSRKRGRRDTQTELVKPVVIKRSNFSLAAHQSMDMEEQGDDMVEQEHNGSEQDIRFLLSTAEKDGSLHGKSSPPEMGDQTTDDSESQTTDSDDIIILEPHVPRKPPCSRIRVEISSLTLDPYSEVVLDDTVQKVFVEFRFPGVPMVETETPLSLRKPGRGEEVYFHFSKVIYLDGVEHEERRQYLYMLLEGSDASGERHRLKFTVVSDPINEEQEECRDVGYAYLDLQFLLRRSVDHVEETLQIVNVLDQSEVIGALRVAVEAREAAWKVYREKRLKVKSSSSSISTATAQLSILHLTLLHLYDGLKLNETFEDCT
ncbi:X-linked retinitis pigmentosa GTPase regulator-interacting protein 1 [Pelodytes ibericus]